MYSVAIIINQEKKLGPPSRRAIYDPGSVIGLLFMPIICSFFMIQSISSEKSLHSGGKLPQLMKCDSSSPPHPPVVRPRSDGGKAIPGSLPLPSAIIPVHVRSWKSTLSPSPPVFPSQAAFLCRYLTAVVNNPHYDFQMSLRPALDLRMGLERGGGVRAGHLL